MAGTLTVQNLQGPSSGANANKIIVPSGHDFIASGQVLQAKSVAFADTTTISTSRTYTALTGASLTLTAKADNSSFLLMEDLIVYSTLNNNGFNAGFFRGTTLILGTNGASGDAWAANNNDSGSGDVANKSGNVSRSLLDSPSINAGTLVTYKAAAAMWTAGQISINFSGYGIKSTLTVMEIAQ